MADSHHYHTYVPNRFAAENSFVGAEYRPQPWIEADVFPQTVPQVYWGGHDNVVACHDKVWALAAAHRRRAAAGSGFVSDFSATAYNDCTFLWDSAFIARFGLYGRRGWDFQATLDNFYAKQHPDGFICRQLREANGSECFSRFDPAGTGPNVFAWTEWEYYTHVGDRDRLVRVFPAIAAYGQWCRRYRTWPDGSYWATGWSSGMDNQPRLPGGYLDREAAPPGGHHAWYEHGHLTWVDACFQAILAARCTVRIAEEIGRGDEVGDFRAEAELLTTWCNRHLWNEGTGFYHDRRRDGTFSPVMTIGAYWALLAEAVPPERLARFVALLEDPRKFNREHRVPSLAADTAEYDPEGGYWRGGVWPPTNFMVVRGLETAGYADLAHRIARNHLDHVAGAFARTGTLWENYAPDVANAGRSARDFVGWSGLGPVAGLYEHVFGIDSDPRAGTIRWRIRLTEAHGVRRLPWGREGFVDLHCPARRSPAERPCVSVRSSAPVSVTITWDGDSEAIVSE